MKRTKDGVRPSWVVFVAFALALLAGNGSAFASVRHDRATERLLYSAYDLAGRFTPRSAKGQVDKAIALYQRVILSSAEARYKVAAYWGEGRVYEKTSQSQAALRAYKTLFQEYPGSASAPQALYEIGKLELDAGNPRAALETLNGLEHSNWGNALGFSRVHSDAHVLGARCYLALSETAEARTELKRALDGVGQRDQERINTLLQQLP